MNPALPILLALSALGLGARRWGPRWKPEWSWEWGSAWTVCGLAGMLLLAPALAIPDGIPSPAATLALDAPWLGLADAADGNLQLRDITHQVQPWLIFTRSELRAGRLPFWNPHQFSGTPFWSNGSSAPLFPLHLLFALLPLQFGLLLLPWLRVVIGGVGTWAFARALGAGRQGALTAAVVYPLSGMIASFLLFPMANVHPLVPWIFLATERLARLGTARGGWAPLAVLGGLALAAGHPETAVFTAILAGIYLLVRGSARPVATWARFAGAWVAAGAISAVHTLPLALTLVDSSKWLATEAPLPVPLAVVGGLLLRLVLPYVYGSAALETWWGPFNDPATAIYAGIATLPLAVAAVAAIVGAARADGVGPAADPGGTGSAAGGTENAAGGTGSAVGGTGNAAGGWDRRWLAVAAMTLFAFLAAYQAPGIRNLLGALPVLDKALTHYFKFGAELGLALLAAKGVDLWIGGRQRAATAGGAAMVALGLGAAWAAYRGDWALRGLVSLEAAWTAGALAVAGVLAGAAFILPAAARRRLAWGLPALLAADLALAHAPANPGLSGALLYPETPAVRFLEEQTAVGIARLAGTGTVLHPNAAMVYGLYDVRGDTPVKLERYQRVYATFASPHPVYFRPIRDWASPWPDRLGVRWVVGRPGELAPFRTRAPGWTIAYDGPDARVWERPRALPLVRWAGGGAAGIEVVERRPGRWTVRWGRGGAAAARERTLIVAETWDPGWRAQVDGARVSVRAEEGVLLGVDVAGETGTVELAYRPAGFIAGAVLTVLGLLAAVFATWRGRPRPFRAQHGEVARETRG